jgi:hypothetical protein
MAQRSGCLAPFHCGPCKSPVPIDPEAVYYDLCPNQIGGPCSKVWYKMKNGYIYQYTYSFNDDVNFVRAQGYQNKKNGCVMSDLIEIAKREGTNAK